MRDLAHKTRSLLLAGATGLVLLGGAAVVSATPAEAGASTGTWRYYNPGYRAYRGYPAYGYRPYRRHRGGAVAAGVATGLALGAIAATASRPAYAYPAYPAYEAPVDCYWVTRERVNRWGEIVVRRVQVCE